MSDQQEKLTTEKQIKQQRLRNLVDVGRGAYIDNSTLWYQAMLKDELHLAEALALVSGELQAVCQGFGKFLPHVKVQSQPLAIEFIESIVSDIRRDLFQAMEKGINNEEQCYNDEDTTKNSA